ncbi:hypothetical protein ACFLS4_03670 [Bacteroidota bacterium]
MAVEIINSEIESLVQNSFIKSIQAKKYSYSLDCLSDIYNKAYSNIPQKKRISYGGYYVVKILGEYLYDIFKQENLDIYNIGIGLYNNSENRKCKGILLCTLSHYGLDDYKRILPVIEKAAKDNDWEVREFAAGFINKITRKYPYEVKEFYLSLVNSENENIRRFVSESLRPVSDNKWFFKNPDYPLSIIRNLFKENKTYPRTSVGNNLSDWARRKPEMVYEMVKELVKSENKNSYWIAYRACRNLIKKEPLKVMDLLGINEYKYKKKIYFKKDYL